jgi:hypothetical protein
VKLTPARLTVDLGIVAVGVLSLVGSAYGDAVLYPGDLLFTAAWVAALLLRDHRWWAPAAVPLILAVQTLALARWPNDSPLTMLALYVAAWLFGYRWGMDRESGSSAVVGGVAAWPLFLAVAVGVTDEYGESGWADVFYPTLYVVVFVGLAAFIGRTARARGAPGHEPSWRVGSWTASVRSSSSPSVLASDRTSAPWSPPSWSRCAKRPPVAATPSPRRIVTPRKPRCSTWRKAAGAP